MAKVELYEVGPRDGFQNLKDIVPTETKLDLVDRMVGTGIRHLQCTSFVSPKAIPQMADAKELAATCVEKYPDLDLFALIPNLYGAKAALAVGIKSVDMVISLSESHNKANINRTHEQSFAELRNVLDNCPDEMAFFNQFIDKGLIERLELVANSEFGRITYTEAIEILKKNNKKFQFPVEWGVDIQTEHERYLTEVVFKKPVFVTDYPKEIKSFYMKQNPDGKTVAAADMLVPGIGELIGGSQREENYDKLVARMDELGMDKTNYEWYLNLRKFGGVEHAGYGLGFERMIMYLTGIQNIRDVLPFPRTAYGF